jgi:hypothetical protein
MRRALKRNRDASSSPKIAANEKKKKKKKGKDRME